MSPGFLDSGLTFHHFDSIVWEKDGHMLLRIETDDPSNDLLRLFAIAEAFDKGAQARNEQLEANRVTLRAAQTLEPQLTQRDALLKQHADDLLLDAQRYVDLKAALLGTQRYMDLAEASNPLRLVARENLRVLSAQVAQARMASEQHDELLTRRVEVQLELNALRNEIAVLHRQIDGFSYPLPPDPKTLVVVDTRDHRRTILRNTWIGIVIVFMGLWWFASNSKAALRKPRSAAPAANQPRRRGIVQRHRAAPENDAKPAK